MNLQGIDAGLLLWPFLAGLLVLATHVPLGREVLRRGIVFVDLAIAQVAGLGIVAAHGFGWPAEGWRTQVVAVLAALAAAGLLTRLERRWPDIQEPLIGALFVIAASLAALLSAHDPHGGEHLRDLLVGQILWVRDGQVLAAALASAVLLLAWWRFGAGRAWLFHVCLALAVTVSVQLVGVYLVFASLILPALAVRAMAPRRALGLGLAVGGAGYAAGLAASALFDWPSGPVIVVALALAALLGTRFGGARRVGAA
jgi:zinc/manganese transport system permease protein